ARSAALARWLGAEELGRLGYLLALLSFADALALWAGPALLVREASAAPRRDGTLFGTALAIRAGAAGLAGVAAIPLVGTWAFPWLLARAGELGVSILRARRLKAAQVVAGLLPPVALLGIVMAAASRASPHADTALAALALAGAAAAAGQLA